MSGIQWLTSPEHARRFGSRWHKVYLAKPNVRRPPVLHGSLRADLSARLDPEFPEMGVLEAEGATLCGEAGWVVSAEGALLPDHSWYGSLHVAELVGRHGDQLKAAATAAPVRQLDGVCLSLATDHGVASYGHFLMDSISRLELFNRAGFHLEQVDYVFCPRPPPGTGSALFEQLGIPEHKRVWADGNVALRARTIVVTSFPGTRRNYPSWTPRFLQRTFFPSPRRHGRRLYVTRHGGRRNAVNEDAVYRLVTAHGFEIYEPSKSAATPTDFAEASVVVGAHGGGLTDLAFCRPGTRVLELVPTDHVYPYYYTLAEAAGLEYHALVCRSTEERPPGTWGPSTVDFHVDESALEEALIAITRAD